MHGNSHRVKEYSTLCNSRDEPYVSEKSDQLRQRERKKEINVDREFMVRRAGLKSMASAPSIRAQIADRFLKSVE